MTSTVSGTCRDCDRPRKKGAIFCECGALLDYSVPAGEQQADEQADGVAATSREKDLEWPPGPYESTPEPAVASAPSSLRVVHCPNENCKVLNPEKLLFCWKCGTPVAQGVEAVRPWSLRRALRLEKAPLRAGERTPSRKPFLGKNPMALLRVGLLALAVLLLVGVLVIGGIKAGHSTRLRVVSWYASSREALFPRFKPVHPSGLRYPAGNDPEHPVFAAFDQDLSTYWVSTTPRDVWDKIFVHFKPAPKEINEVTVFAGDPTASGTIVPQSIQMTFYTWDSHPCRSLPPGLRSSGSQTPRSRGGRTARTSSTHCGVSHWRVLGIAKQFPLLNTPTEQRFSTGTQRNVGQIVITVRGVHRTADAKAQAALTDVGFYDKH